MELGFKFGGPKFFVQEFEKVGILILKVDNDALLLLLLLLLLFCIFSFFKINNRYLWSRVL